jgi:uncharacterized membrane protein HdeD (DUF308 family)
MNNNQSISKTDSKWKAIVSLSLGIVSIISIVFAFSFPIPGVSTLILYIAFFLAIIGLILGVGGLRSTKKKLAIVGIALCIIAFILFLKAPLLVRGI